MFTEEGTKAVTSRLSLVKLALNYSMGEAVIQTAVEEAVQLIAQLFKQPIALSAAQVSVQQKSYFAALH